jgi:hypothetical protein
VGEFLVLMSCSTLSTWLKRRSCALTVRTNVCGTSMPLRLVWAKQRILARVWGAEASPCAAECVESSLLRVGIWGLREMSVRDLSQRKRVTHAALVAGSPLAVERFTLLARY